MKKYFEVNESSEEIEVTTGYCLGGYNYFNGARDGRGYYVYVHPVDRTGGSVCFVLFDGFKKLLREVNRQSKKVMVEVEIEADKISRELAVEMARQKGWTLKDEE